MASTVNFDLLRNRRIIAWMSTCTEQSDWQQVGIRQLLSPEQIAAYNQRKNLPGVVFFLGHLTLTCATGGLLYLSLGSSWAPLLFFLHGIVIVYWFQPFHECAHKTAYKSPWMNSTVYWFSALISMVEPSFFYFEHMQHHRYTQRPGVDPERIPQADNFWGYLFYLTGLPYHYYQLSGLGRHCFGHLYDFERQFIPQNKRPRVFFEARVILSIYAALFIASLLLQSWFLAIYWLLPRLMGEPFMRMARLSEHQGCPLVPDLLRNTRTVIAALPIKYLGWYACYHAEHHLSPNTPFHAVRKLHKKIAGEIVHIETGYLKIHGKIFADARAGRLPRG